MTVAFPDASDVFAASGYWIALVTPDDERHEKAVALRASLGNRRIVTTHLVLNELLNPRSGTTAHERQAAIHLVEQMKQNPQTSIEPQTVEQFEEAFSRFRDVTDDKEWSITDCASFLVMERLGIWQALTGDHHFAQDGFFVMLR